MCEGKSSDVVQLNVLLLALLHDVHLCSLLLPS